jgi:ADP-ribose pyrophosphatase YjhB (NUDIX family)
MTEEKRTKIVLAVIQDKKGKVLIVEKQKKEKNKYGIIINWSLPGGKVEENEELATAAEREVLEETGYKVRAIEQISYREHPQFPVTIYYWRCEVVEKVSEISDVEEIKSAAWVETKVIRNYITTDFDPKVSEMLGI